MRSNCYTIILYPLPRTTAKIFANYSMLIAVVSISIFAITKSHFSKMNKEPILLLFGQRVQEIRKARNLSQEKLAELAGVHRTYIGMIERAEKNITLLNIAKIAKALNVNISILVGE